LTLTADALFIMLFLVLTDLICMHGYGKLKKVKLKEII